MLEVEVKVKVNDVDGLIAKLVEQGFIEGTTVYEYDWYFNGELVDFRKVDKALRIRKHVCKDVTKYVLNYKGPKIDDITMAREETQFEVPSYEAGLTVINGLGYYVADTVEKTRIHYKKDDVVCCIDNVTGLGDFLEIEIMADGDRGYETAISKINSLLNQLSFDMSDTIRKSYLSMLQGLDN